jgi:hypothetical protein
MIKIINHILFFFKLKGIKIFIFIALLFSCGSISLKSQEKGHSIPIDNYYEKLNVIPVKVYRKEYAKIKRDLSKKFNKSIKYNYRTKDHSIFLADKSTIVALDSLKYHYELSNHNPPFRYFVTDYQERLRRGFVDLEDLRTGYKDYKLNLIYLKALSEKFPNFVTYYDLGKTRLGRPIPAIKITSSNELSPKSSVLFNGAHHSNELIGVEHCYDIIYNILNNPDKYKNILDNVNVWIIPIVNPDGSYLFWYKSLVMGRKNGYLAPGFSEDNIYRGTDLNRNYPFKWNSGVPRASSDNPIHSFYRGVKAASEPETRAVMDLAEKERFLFSISFHSFATKLLYPYTTEDTTNPNPDYVQDLAKRLVRFTKSYHPIKKFEAVKNIYAVDGTDQDYLYFKYGTNALLAESSHKNIEYSNIPIVMEGFRPLWENLLEEFISKYKLILRIEDEEGYPLEAKIILDEIQTFEGEEFTSHPVSGYYYKMVLEEKEYVVQIINKDYEPRTIKAFSKLELEPTIIQLIKKKNNKNTKLSNYEVE